MDASASTEFYVSADGVNWGTPVAIGTFPNAATAQQVSFPAKTGAYVRFRSLQEVRGAGNPFTSVAEIEVFGSPN